MNPNHKWRAETIADYLLSRSTALSTFQQQDVKTWLAVEMDLPQFRADGLLREFYMRFGDTTVVSREDVAKMVMGYL